VLRRAGILAATLALLTACLAGAAHAKQYVKLTASFTPDRLNTPTTISFGFQISAAGQVPSALTSIALRYPVDLGLATSDLGLATCHTAQLELYGPAGCPANSRMGHGSAIAEIAFNPFTIQEKAAITLLAGPPEKEHLDIIVYVEARSPISAEIIFSAQLLPEPPPFGGRLQFEIPLVPTIPEAPDVAIVHLQTTLGSLGLTYYERVHGRLVPYHPAGILLPKTCPLHGFPFAANLTFQDGTHARARTSVPCPMRA
jgi:hypothetical protein